MVGAGCDSGGLSMWAKSRGKMEQKRGKSSVAKQKPAGGKLETALPEPVDRREALAKMALRPSVNAAAVVEIYAKSTLGQQDLGSLVEALVDGIDDVWKGDMKRAEGMLYSQAHALQAIFMNLARRAASQEYLKQWEAYLRMALKAQNQCRMTLETLATLKNPPVVVARQANINNGGVQQVNNGTTPAQSVGDTFTHAANRDTVKSELLEVSDGQRMGARATGTAGGTDPELEAVGAVHRTAHR